MPVPVHGLNCGTEIFLHGKRELGNGRHFIMHVKIMGSLGRVKQCSLDRHRRIGGLIAVLRAVSSQQHDDKMTVYQSVS